MTLMLPFGQKNVVLSKKLYICAFSKWPQLKLMLTFLEQLVLHITLHYTFEYNIYLICNKLCEFSDIFFEVQLSVRQICKLNVNFPCYCRVYVYLKKNIMEQIFDLSTLNVFLFD